MKNNLHNKNNSYRVILVDDHTIVRRGIAALLEMDGRYQIVAEANNGEEAVARATEIEADLLITDLSMPRLNGLEMVRRLHRQQPALKILILSMYDDAEFVQQALAEEVGGYILKQSMEDELFEALDTILAGKQYLGASIKLPSPIDADGPANTALTTREREVLQLIAEGYTAAEIADLMSISPHTANRHRANIMQKMNVRNQIELIRLAVERGYVILKKPPAV